MVGNLFFLCLTFDPSFCRLWVTLGPQRVAGPRAVCLLQAMKEKQTLEQQLRLDRRERQNTQSAAKNMHAKAQAELHESRAEIERRNVDVETTV